MENWDGEGDACMNVQCCNVLRNNVKSSFVVTGVMAAAVGIMATLLLFFSYWVILDLDLDLDE